MKLSNTPRLFTAVFAAVMVGAVSFTQPALAQDAKPAEAVKSAPAKRLSYAQVSAATAPIADAYFAAYIAHEWDTLEPLLAESARFQDPTATHIFGKVLSEGREAMMKRFRVSYAGISHMEFTTNRRIISGETALYEGVLHWGSDIGGGTTVDSVTPMVVLISVKNGKIISHHDYVDYAPFIAAVKKARSKK